MTAIKDAIKNLGFDSLVEAIDDLGDKPVLEALNLDKSTPRKNSFLESTNDEGFTPLVFAIEEGYTDLASALVQAGADPMASNNDGDACLIMAIDRGLFSLAQDIIRCSPPIHGKRILSETSQDGVAPIFLAAEGSESVAMSLIHAGAPLSISNDDGDDFLAWLAENGHIALAMETIKAAQSLSKTETKKIIHASNSDSLDVAFIALEQGNRPLIKALIDAGYDLSSTNNDSCGFIASAIALGQDEIAMDAIKSSKPAALESSDEDSNTPLILAIQNGKIDIVNALIMAGANVCVSDEHSTESLPLAIELGHADIARELLRTPNASRKSTLLNSSDANGVESLFLALDAGMEDLACSLIQAGASLNIHLDKQDFIPFAIEGGHRETCMQAILTCWSKRISPNPLNGSDASGVSAFEIALDHDPFIAQALIDAGCDMSFDFESNGESAKKNAARAGLRIAPDPSRIPSASPKTTPSLAIQSPEPEAAPQDPRLPALIDLARVAAKARANAQEKINAGQTNLPTLSSLKR